MQNRIFLPGTNGQIDYFLKKNDITGKRILVLGESAEEIVKLFIANDAALVDYVVEFHQALADSRIKLSAEERVKIRLMEYVALDFANEAFDVVYVQAAISRDERKEMLKEIYRVLLPGGILCAGEITVLNPPLPPVVRNVFERSLISPLPEEYLESTYRQQGFRILQKKAMNEKLAEFYKQAENEMKKSSSAEIKDTVIKKGMKQYRHEINVFLKLGGVKAAGFTAAVFRKESNEKVSSEN